MFRIKDIAEAANVSEGTVDRVIHNRGSVSKKTEAKVKKILEKHNFTVNPIASALAMKSKKNIALLMPEHNAEDLFWESPSLGVEKSAEEIKSFGVEVNSFKFKQYDPESYLEAFGKLIRIKPSAVVLVPNFSEETKQIVKALEAQSIPYIFINIDLDGFDNLTYIGQDAYKAGYIAAKLMCLKNTKSSSFLIVQSRFNITKNNSVSRRINGFKDYLAEHEIDYKSETLKIDNLDTSEATKTIINNYLNSNPDIKGVFVPSSRIHIIAECIDDARLKSLELIGFDDTPQNTECLLNDSVSFLISQKPFDQGYESVKLMVDYLLQNKLPESKIYLPIDILIKENVNFNKKF